MLPAVNQLTPQQLQVGLKVASAFGISMPLVSMVLAAFNDPKVISEEGILDEAVIESHVAKITPLLPWNSSTQHTHSGESITRAIACKHCTTINLIK